MNEMAVIDGSELNLGGLPEELQLKILAASDMLKDSAHVAVNKIRNDAKSYILPDNEEVDSFVGHIVAVKHANIHYPGDYQEGVSNPPDCVAILEGDKDAAGKDLSPHANVSAKYSVNCADCKHFQWGSAAKGKGKACSEHTLLAVSVPALGDELFLVEEKKKNAATVDGYLGNVNNKYKHPLAVLTKFRIGEKTKWDQTFQAVSATPTDTLALLAGRIDEANEMLTQRVLGSYKKEAISTAEDAVEAPSRKGRERP